jgi:two-component system cell cycle sensor histidine kinase/response regulator CckA
MEQLHSLLKRQLRRHLGGLDPIPKEWLRFIDAVNSAYFESDADRRMLERSLELTSQELLNANQKAEDRFQKAFHANPEPISIATVSDGCFIDVNESFLRVTGYRRDEIIGRTSLELNIWARPNDRIKVIDALTNKIPVRDSEIMFHTKSGRERMGLQSAEVIEVGGQKCVLAVLKDVTEEKLQENRLRQSQKMEAIGQLSGGIAHDFNNLLNVISGYSELLLEQLDANGGPHRHTEQIKKAADRAASLIRQLLAFSRQQVVEMKVLNLNKVVGEMAKLLPPLIGEHIELRTILGSDLGQVKADQGQIEQIVMNLAVNARDAMPEGGKLIMETKNVSVDQEFASRYPPMIPGDYVTLVVSDTGVGMDTQTVARIFEPFFTTKEQGKGTGLGLATVYGAAKQNGGYVWVETEPGQGTTFGVYLPLLRGQVQQTQTSNIAPAAPARGSETILLAEDEELLRRLTRSLLEESGYTVLEACHGSDALAVASGYVGPIHLLLTDVVMPGMNGRVLAEKLQLIHPEMKVVFMSGYTGFHDRSLLDSRMPLIAKPFTRDAMLRKLRETLVFEDQCGARLPQEPNPSDVNTDVNT